MSTVTVADDFSSLWRKVLAKVTMTERTRAAGFLDAPHETTRTAAVEFAGDDDVTPDVVRDQLERMGRGRVLLVIFDEFDRLTDRATRRTIPDTIKALADDDVPATIVVVGIADTVGELIAEHESIDRSLIQIPMPRMDLDELYELLDNGTNRLGMVLEPKAAAQDRGAVAGTAPVYAPHRSACHPTDAIRDRRRPVTSDDVKRAIRDAVANTQQSLRDNYRRAVSSPQTDNLLGQVMLA